MSVRIRMKKMGRTHRPFFRICAMDRRAPRDGRVLEELGTYDPSVPDTDARAILKAERIDYWLSVGAQPSEKCAVLIKKYGKEGTHLEAQQAAFQRLAIKPQAPAAVAIPLPSKQEPTREPPAEEVIAEASEETATAETATPAAVAAEAPVEEATAEAPPETITEAPAEEAKADGPATGPPKDDSGDAAEKSE